MAKQDNQNHNGSRSWRSMWRKPSKKDERKPHQHPRPTPLAEIDANRFEGNTFYHLPSMFSHPPPSEIPSILYTEDWANNTLPPLGPVNRLSTGNQSIVRASESTTSIDSDRKKQIELERLTTAVESAAMSTLTLADKSSYALEKYILNKEGNAVEFTFGRNVNISVAEDEFSERSRDSGHANSTVLCDYKWENKTSYDGRLLSASDRYIAYRLFHDANGEAIRVMERETRERHLLRDFRARTVDLLWATHAPLLAILDVKGNVYIYEVNENPFSLTKYLTILSNRDKADPNAKLVWCPFVADHNHLGEPLNILATVSGRQAKIYFLNEIRGKFGSGEADTLDSALCSDVIAAHNITCFRISPDGTAYAVTTTDGALGFYIPEVGVVHKAHEFIPRAGFTVENMLFLDNLVVKDTTTPRDPVEFWNYVVLVSDDGRRLDIYDCSRWECVGKLCFDSAFQLNRLDVTLDNTSRYIYLFDGIAMNLFCLEMTPPGIDQPPFFVSCTQICFSTPLLSLAAVRLEEMKNEPDILMLDEDATTDKGVEVSFAAISKRSVLTLTVDLERALQVDLDASALKATEIVKEKIQNRHSIVEQKQVWADEPTSELGVGAEAGNLLSPTATYDKKSLPSPAESSATSSGRTPSRRKKETELHHSHHHGNDVEQANVDPATITAAVNSANAQANAEIRKLTAAVAQLTECCMRSEKRNEEMATQLAKLTAAQADFRRESTDNLADVLEKISYEIRSRELQSEELIKQMNETLRVDVQRIVEASLNANAVSLQSTMEMTNGRVVDTVKSVLTQVLVPSVDNICTQLFRQLNESFRDGLQEFMEQIREEMPSGGSGLPDYEVKTQMIENGQITFYTQITPRDRQKQSRIRSADSNK